MPTLTNIMDTDWHSKELRFRPNVSIELDFFAKTLGVKRRNCKYRRVLGNLHIWKIS